MPDLPEESSTLVDVEAHQEQGHQRFKEHHQQQQMQLPAVLPITRPHVIQEQQLPSTSCWGGGTWGGMEQPWHLEQQQKGSAAPANHMSEVGQKGGFESEPWQQQQQPHWQRHMEEAGLGQQLSCNDAQGSHRQPAPWGEYERGQQPQQQWLPAHSNRSWHAEVLAAEQQPWPHHHHNHQQQQQEKLWQQASQPCYEQRTPLNAVPEQHDGPPQGGMDRFGGRLQWGAQNVPHEAHVPLYLQQQQEQHQQMQSGGARPSVMFPALSAGLTPLAQAPVHGLGK
jgi:hypothetical protein